MGRSVGSSQCTLYAPEANRISIFLVVVFDQRIEGTGSRIAGFVYSCR